MAERLEDYPKESYDPFMDPPQGRKFTNYSVNETEIEGNTLVYFHQETETDEMVNTSLGFRKMFSQGVVVCGYKVAPKGVFRLFRKPKIRIIPQSERPEIRQRLTEKLSSEPAYMSFWDPLPRIKLPR